MNLVVNNVSLGDTLGMYLMYVFHFPLPIPFSCMMYLSFCRYICIYSIFYLDDSMMIQIYTFIRDRLCTFACFL